jgi:hypothetical protein
MNPSRVPVAAGYNFATGAVLAGTFASRPIVGPCPPGIASAPIFRIALPLETSRLMGPVLREPPSRDDLNQFVSLLVLPNIGQKSRAHQNALLLPSQEYSPVEC